MKAIPFRLLAILYVLMLLLAAVVPFQQGESLSDTYTLHIRGDYLLHAIFYIPLPVFLRLAFGNPAGRLGRKVWIPVLLLAFSAVILFEGVQYWIPYRGFNINDMMANGVGVLLGSLFCLVLRSFLTRLLPAPSAERKREL